MAESPTVSTDDKHQFPILGLSLKEVQQNESRAGESPHASRLSKEKVDPFVRVQNLVWIKGNTYYKAALDDWKQQRKSLGGKLERWEKRAEELNNQVYNVVGFFSVFQGVILSAVAQLNSQQATARPLCNKVWYPFALSLLAALAAGVGIGLKFIALSKVDRSIQTFKRRIVEAERREALLQKLGSRFTFNSLLRLDRSPSPPTTDRLFRRIAVIGGLFVFTVAFCLSYFAILCDKLVF